ncbi:hypothetical protein [Streptomyces sp. NA02950]|uniref:hypothetical protein n=1 Tax=Streptomyces sp. NA02950 TaxID=2742137 RepID=UPI0034CE9442
MKLTVTAGGGAHDAASTTYTAVPLWPLVPAAVAVLGAGTGAGAWLLRRRRRAPQAAVAGPEADGPEPRTAVAEAGADE